jgi:glutamate synthase (NADPH/NADH) small chain
MHEIEKVREMGVEINTGILVGRDVTLSNLLDENDAVLVATGSRDTRRLDIPGSDLGGVINGYEFLERVFSSGIDAYAKKPGYDLGNDIVVVGGGDSALDSARTALRLTHGSGNVVVAYRRAEEDMPADPIMIEEAKEEGVKFRFLAQPKFFEGSNGRISAVVMDSMKLGDPDQSGRRHPEPVPGKEFSMRCSSTLLAIGRGPDSFLQKKARLKMGKHDAIEVSDNYETSMHGVFAAGDVTSGETLVVKAMESGREAAQRVHEFLMGLESQHISFYDRYYKHNFYDKMLEGEVDSELPPD